MGNIESLEDRYSSLDKRFSGRKVPQIDPSYLLTFDYEFPNQPAEIVIDTPEFTAVCPWTNLPDFGTLKIVYVPGKTCIELKSLKYYLMSFSNVEIVQEHAANRILLDLVKACVPIQMTVTLDYNVRGGLHTSVAVEHSRNISEK